MLVKLSERGRDDDAVSCLATSTPTGSGSRQELRAVPLVARKGEVRDGGAFSHRACRIASWNSWPKEADHLQQRWYEFASTV
jgi:hypothetical protein